GDKAPDFEIEETDGTKSRLSDYLGKTVMLQFTASWCSVCRTEMPFIEDEIWQPLREEGLVLIGIDREEPIDTVTDFAETIGVTYPLALDLKADIFSLYADRNSGVTRNVIVNKEGNIAFLSRLFEREEFDEMKAVIKNLLNV
ncbi:MAG: TlpA family protein disulfide reductase, partial [Flavobacteriales bacterium]|nr:TlpA family protein disulfide reductase [Flavobacteriales bacterium]